MIKQSKPKKCKAKDCGKEFVPVRPLQQVCSPTCALRYSAMKGAKKQALDAKLQRREYRDAKDKAKPRGEWAKEAQTAFNSWVRARDADDSCISCGSHTGKQNAGHYRSVGSSPELRFEPDNCHLQCERCNSYLSGNLINYRINLIKKIGADRVEWLEGKHEAKHYSIEDLQDIKKRYSGMARELRGRI